MAIDLASVARQVLIGKDGMLSGARLAAPASPTKGDSRFSQDILSPCDAARWNPPCG